MHSTLLFVCYSQSVDNVIFMDQLTVMICSTCLLCVGNVIIITQCLTMVLDRNYDPVDLVYYFSV